MSTGGPSQPASADAWVAAVHAGENDFEPLGAALVVAEDRVLTCAHVVMPGGTLREPLWVAFPKAGDCPRRRVASVTAAYSMPVRDLAVLTLAEPVPAGIGPAPLRCPKGQDMVSRRWWAFGFPAGDPLGDSADGQVGASLSYGWVRLDTGSPGVGKSAILGRIVTTADAAIRASLPAADTEVRATVGSVSCAVHAKGKTAQEVAQEIARAASAKLPEQPDDLAPALRDATWLPMRSPACNSAAAIARATPTTTTHLPGRWPRGSPRYRGRTSSSPGSSPGHTACTTRRPPILGNSISVPRWTRRWPATCNHSAPRPVWPQRIC
jgi:hypothetical protein